MKTDKVTPIVYVPGTGGHFLCTLLNCAANNFKESVRFSEWGNLHDSKFGFNNNINVSNVERIQKYHESKTYFISTHSSNIDFLLTHFDKIIIITYDNADSLEIASALTMKNYYTASKTKEELISFFRTHIILTQISISKVKKLNDINILNVSWFSLYKDCPNTLIQTLSDFCNIPKENFNINTIEQWRILTANGIEEAKKYLP